MFIFPLVGMGWDKLSGTGVSAALKIVQRHSLLGISALRSGGVTPMNNFCAVVFVIVFVSLCLCHCVIVC